MVGRRASLPVSFTESASSLTRRSLRVLARRGVIQHAVMIPINSRPPPCIPEDADQTGPH